MSDRVVLDGRSTRNERTRDGNAREPVWHILEPNWHLERPFLNRDAREDRANQRTEHDDRSTYQTEHSKHIQVILHMKIKSWVI